MSTDTETRKGTEMTTTRHYPGQYTITTRLGIFTVTRIGDDWFVTYPTCVTPDDVYPTLRDAKKAIRHWVANDPSIGTL